MSQQAKAGDTPVLSKFAQGNVVILESIHAKGTIRIIESPDKTTTKNAWATGKRDDVKAQFTVHVRGPGIIALQNVSKPECWLTIKDGTTNGNGDGGPYCEFIITEAEGKYVHLESVMFPGEHVGFMSKGKSMGSQKIGVSDRGRFIPYVHTHARITRVQTSPPPAPLPVSDPPTTTGPARAGNTPLLAIFSEGAVVLLQSRSNGKNLRVVNGEVEGLGGQGVYSQFRVHVRRPRIVALENVGTPGEYLAINQGEMVVDEGGKFCDLLLKEVGEAYICLESVEHPGQHVGVFPNGDVKPPASTDSGHDGQFKPLLPTQSQPLAQPQYTPPAQPQPQYQPPAQPQPQYQPPPQPQPQYQPSAQPQPQYQPPPQQPQYQPPPQQPQYQPPAQPQPQYQPPAQPQPQYQPPAQPQPQYQPPAQQPQYQPSAQPQPQYQPPPQQPQYQPSAQPQPQYQPPPQQPQYQPPPQYTQYQHPPQYQPPAEPQPQYQLPPKYQPPSQPQP